MNIILNNDNGYNIDIEITDADEKKNNEDTLYDLLSLVATLVGEIQSKLFDFDSMEEEKKGAFFMLDSVKEMLTAYYDDVEKKMNKQREGAKIYGYMEDFYEEFLERNSLSDSHIFEILDGKKTDMAAVLVGEEIHFSIIDTSSNEELIIIHKMNVSDIKKYADEPIHDAVEANAVAIIIYDKLLGESKEKNPARNKGGLWFDEQAKKIVGSL